MGKLDYLDALKRAMTGLAPELQAKTLAYYEQRFVDGVMAGRTEEEVAKELDDPKKIAMTLRANTHLKSFEEKKTPANAARVVVAFAGLAIFNLFMLVPGMVFASLLAALYASGLAMYAAGIIITASGLSGANELVLDGPLRKVVLVEDERGRGGRRYENVQTKVSISAAGVNIEAEPTNGTKGDRTRVSIGEEVSVNVDESVSEEIKREAGDAAREAGDAVREAGAAAREAASAAAEAQAEAEAAAEAIPDVTIEERRSARAMRRAEAMADRGIVISTDLDDESRATQTVIGFGLVLGGIILLLLSLVVTKYTLIGIKRYVQMNISLLKGH